MNVAEILAKHVTLELECIDRMLLNVYVPRLQSPGMIAKFFRDHRGAPFASSALMAPMSRAFVAALVTFAEREGVPLVRFERGVRKEDVAAEHLRRFVGQEGVLFIGVAQEKTRVFRTEKRRNPETGASYPWIVPGSAMVNQYYVYALDRDVGHIQEGWTREELETHIRDEYSTFGWLLEPLLDHAGFAVEAVTHASSQVFSAYTCRKR